MQTYSEFCDEAKQVGIIYHFTTVKSILALTSKKGDSILTCEIFRFFSHNSHISTTRYFDIGSPTTELNSITRPVRITLDGDKLSNRFKVKPINGLMSSDEDVFGTHKNDYRAKHKSEAEEVICPNKDVLFDLKDYVLEIQLKRTHMTETEELMDILKKNLKGTDIDVNIVRHFKPYKDITENLKKIEDHYMGFDIYKKD